MTEHEFTLTLQEHHITNLLKFSEGHGVGFSVLLALSDMVSQGYASSPDEKEELEKCLRLAIKCIKSGNYVAIPDGIPDIICLGCNIKHKNGEYCSINEDTRNAVKGSLDLIISLYPEGNL